MTERVSISLSSCAPDLIPQDAPADVWNQAQNVVFRNGETVASSNDAPEFAFASINPLVVIYTEPNEQNYWVYANKTGIYSTDGSTESDITPAGWADNQASNAVFTACVINGFVVINSSSKDPVYWNGLIGQICLPLPDWPIGGRCLAMRNHKNFLMAVGFISEGGQRLRWSDAAPAGELPSEWDPKPSNLAGFVDLAPLSDPIVDGLTMRDSFIAYKNDSTWSLDLVGGNEVFSVRQMFAEYGCAATNAVGRGPNDEHILVTSAGDIAITDGISFSSVLSGRAQRTFYQDFDGAAGSLYGVTTLMREKLGIVAYPSAGSAYADQMLYYDFDSGAISFRDADNVTCLATGRFLNDLGDANEWDGQVDSWNTIARTWNGDIRSTTVEDVILGLEDGFALLGGSLSTRRVYLEKVGMAFGNPQSRKLVSRIWPKINGAPGDRVKFRLGGQEVAEGPTALTPAVDFVIGSNQPIDTFISGRYITMLVESDGIHQWRLGSFDLEYREQGQW